ncbi:lasso peptide biosynthesis B2 protein [Amycolatopsis sp. NPDC059021]|uniref:lasso peptide biosynthesis B2 protein n=1 Tax=Amycolatopsis sp. NPDC059021 TaxID=3346704 RepID=UPI003671A2F8
MSTPEALFTAGRPRWHARVRARLAVALALALAHLPPRRIRRILTVLRAGARPATYRQAQEARSAVIAVSVVCAGKGCLPRSIATTLLCRAQGSWPVWTVGVRSTPFAAHAWVEAEGRAVDEGEHVLAFRPLLKVGPHHRQDPA